MYSGTNFKVLQVDLDDTYLLQCLDFDGESNQDTVLGNALAQMLGGVPAQSSNVVWCYLSKPCKVGEVIQGKFDKHPRQSFSFPTLLVKSPVKKGFG